jgi:hypothetical protein
VSVTAFALTVLLVHYVYGGSGIIVGMGGGVVSILKFLLSIFDIFHALS